MKVGSSINGSLTGVDKAKTDRVEIASQKEAKDSPRSSADLGSASKVELSPKAQEMKRIKELATTGDDVDAAKVAKYQKLIDDGEYSVDPSGIADRLVDEHLKFS